MAEEKEIKINDLESDETDANESADHPQTVSEDKDRDDQDAEGQVSGDGESPEDQIAALEERYLRLAADFDNYKKRTSQLLQEASRRGSETILTDVLEVVDNFERALAHSNDENDAEQNDVSLRDGMRMIHNQILELLKRHGVTPIEALGQPFNPNLHDALLQVESSDYPDGSVAEELTRGWKIGDRVLRHSKVAVSTLPKDNKDKEK